MKFPYSALILLSVGNTIVPTSSFSNTKINFSERSLFQRKKLSFATLSQSLLLQNDDNLENTVDHAPCFDSVCTSIPEIKEEINEEKDATSTLLTAPMNEKDHRGEATARLGDATGPTVWSEFGRLSQENDVANLGQGFPDWLPPTFAVESLVEAATDTVDRSPHQYTRTAGHPNLVNMLAKRYSSHLKRKIDPMGEVAVTVGASQALYLSLQTLVKPGDEVILFEPFFDLYVNQVKLAGGTPVYVPLTFKPYKDDNNDSFSISGGEWILERHLLDEAITSNTRAIILNSPHNPTGKIFTRAEMESIAHAMEEKASPECVVLSDEVYKYIVHSPPKEDDNTEEKYKSVAENDEQKTVEKLNIINGSTAAITCPGHTHFASLPNMYDRTITISSAGKTFSATGWQVGWCVGPTKLISPIHQLLPYVQFCASTVIQETLARTLMKAELPYQGYINYYEYLKAMYTAKRDLLGNALREAGFGIPDYSITPGGGFFIFARIGPAILDAIPKERVNALNPVAPGGIARADWALCQWLAEEKGILCIPSSPFYSRKRAMEGASDEYIRIAFCKTADTIEEAAQAFQNLKNTILKNQSEQKENSGEVDGHENMVIIDDDSILSKEKLIVEQRSGI